MDRCARYNAWKVEVINGSNREVFAVRSENILPVTHAAGEALQLAQQVHQLAERAQDVGEAINATTRPE
eukprot:CAMPEP_0117599172 /NCGR_PEP_ID=MMETSP0784-20121206/75800_1 /TAXON_ID=39447 /ORGANISM="" /LENGTH=68 /DNA_ID=CAMNT_0005401695 /DNA_START=87 /DNA_END=290 /DNA_ORIENTATION=+